VLSFLLAFLFVLLDPKQCAKVAPCEGHKIAIRTALKASVRRVNIYLCPQVSAVNKTKQPPAKIHWNSC